MADFNAMQEALVACDEDKLVGLVNGALAEDTTATEILKKGSRGSGQQGC